MENLDKKLIYFFIIYPIAHVSNENCEMPCSFCNLQGHNICTCKDPRIVAAIHSLISNFVVPIIGGEFTDGVRTMIYNYLMNEFPRPLLFAIGVQYSGVGRKCPISLFIERITGKLAAELAHANQLSPNDLNEWSICIMGISYSEYLDSLDMDFEWYEDRTPTVVCRHPVFDIQLVHTESDESFMECVICQEDKPSGLFVKTQCDHSFCESCTTSLLLSKGLQRACCPLCRADIHSLETTGKKEYEKLNDQFNQTGALLKDCSLAAFGTSMWHWRSCSKTIDMFLVEYAEYKELVKIVNKATTDQEKAEYIWDFIQTIR